MCSGDLPVLCIDLVLSVMVVCKHLAATFLECDVNAV